MVKDLARKVGCFEETGLIEKKGEGINKTDNGDGIR
jgi:hypothetical protein